MSGATSQKTQRAEHGNVALVREAVGRVAAPAVCDLILEAAIAESEWPQWDDFGAITDFVRGPLSDAVQGTMDEAAAWAVCEDALSLLLNRGQWRADSLPPPELLSTLPPNGYTSSTLRSDPVVAVASSVTRRVTKPYFHVTREDDASEL
jgi:hypothetical protein